MELIYKSLIHWEPSKDRQNRFAELSDGRANDLMICDADTGQILSLIHI